MAFDIESSKPVGFDLASAKPVAPGKENSPNAAMQPGQQIGDEKLPGFDELRRLIGAIPAGASEAAGGIANAVTHPIDAVAGLYKKGLSAIDTGISAAMSPVETTKKVGDVLRNTQPEDVGKLAGSSLVGGAAGKAAGVLGDVVGPSVKALQKPVSPTIRDLANKGVVTTPGMRGGKVASALEQRATSIPLVGDMIKRARGKATEQWNRAEINDAIKDAGGAPLPKGRTGRDALFHAETEIGKSYDRVLSKMSGDLNSADPQGVTFKQFLDQTKTLTSQGLEKRTAKTVNNIIDNKVIAKFKAGKATGENIKEIQETLRKEIDDLKSGTYQDRKAAEILKQVSAEMKSMLKRENPKLAEELNNVDRGYAKFKASSKASLYSTKNQGTYTPAQKLQAIKVRDKSKDKGRFSTGQAAGQKEAEAVESVIGNTEPDSGSAGRIATMETILTGSGVAAGHPLAGLVAAAGPLMYSQPVLKYLQKRALNKGGKYTPIGKSAQITGSGLAASPGSIDQNGVGR